MKANNLHIGRIVVTCLWLVAGAGVIALLIAAANSRNEKLCKGYEIRIDGKLKSGGSLTEEEVLQTLNSNNKKLSLKGKRITSFNLHRLETKLRQHVWIKDAELYFDNNGILKIKIKERVPIAKINSTIGEGFYIDSSCHRLPINNNKFIKLPVFSGYPNSTKKVMSESDKKLVRQIKELSEFLLKDTFWLERVSVIQITHQREFELMPVSANHIIELGTVENKEKKFNNLKIFYHQVLAKTGPDKYKRIKLQYDKQVVGVKD